MMFSAALRDNRRRNGLTQEELARRLGTSQTAISQAENSQHITLSRAEVRRAFEVLGWPGDLLAAWAQYKSECLDVDMQDTLAVLTRARSLSRPDVITKVETLLRKQREFQEELVRFAEELRELVSQAGVPNAVSSGSTMGVLRPMPAIAASLSLSQDSVGPNDSVAH